MGIFSRIGDLLKANINDLIDRAEDPEKMVKLRLAEGCPAVHTGAGQGNGK